MLLDSGADAISDNRECERVGVVGAIAALLPVEVEVNNSQRVCNGSLIRCDDLQVLIRHLIHAMHYINTYDIIECLLVFIIYLNTVKYRIGYENKPKLLPNSQTANESSQRIGHISNHHIRESE